MSDQLTDITLVIDYYLDQARDDSRPPHILLAMCRLKWPEHSDWQIREDADPDEPELCYHLRDCVDSNGVSAADLL